MTPVVTGRRGWTAARCWAADRDELGSVRGPAGEARVAIANLVSRPTCRLDTRFKGAELLNIGGSALAMARLELRADVPFQRGVA